jgi:putative membrane-bound dehydrogenase-like protein
MTFVRLVSLLALLLCPRAGSAASANAPTVNDPRLELTLIAAEPDIVTPIGLAIAKNGRLFVVESHTHFPPANYPGPKYDRVKLFEDTNGDGRPDKISVFADGLHHSMNLAFSPDGRLYLVHRNGVLCLEDKDGDGVSESRTTILEMETRGDYPHNGLGGITFSADGWLYVGQGENLGERYTLKGSDGRSHSGGGEGGNIFRCRADGSQLELVATGFWNPFGLAWYGQEFLLAVDNDPDARPPNRLLDVVRYGDYGFKFRFGRSGLHPFQAWNGELPGTLPMVGGTGEGVCSVLPCSQTSLPTAYREALLVTASWDHQVEVHRPKPFGASLRADKEILVEGDASFRPVALAAAPDGAVYFTDWVDVSYNVHGKGRIWRLAAKPGLRAEPHAAWAIAPNGSRKQMNRLLQADSVGNVSELFSALSSKDPFIRSAAIGVLSQPVFSDAVSDALASKSASMRLGALLASRRTGVPDAGMRVGKLLADPDPQVRLMALVWAGEERLIALTNRLELALSAGPLTPALLRAHAATAQIFSSPRPTSLEPDSHRSTKEMSFLDLAEPLDEQPFIETLKAPSGRVPKQVRLEAVRSLAQTTNAEALALLKRVAFDRRNGTELRCEAILSLAGTSSPCNALLPLLDDDVAAIRIEAARALRMAPAEAKTQEILNRKFNAALGRDPHLADQLRRSLASQGVRNAEIKPAPQPPADDAHWRIELTGNGDVASGRRIFFHPSIGCSKCHRVEDHGGHVGPDLSTIARGSDREKLMQSILHPSRDIAPQFVAHTVETKDRQSFTGLLISQTVDGGLTLFTAEGKAVLIPLRQISAHTQSKISLMPEGLDQALTPQDFRDLMAFLLSRK